MYLSAPSTYAHLFEDAGLSWAREIADYYIGFVDFAEPSAFPDVDVDAEKGSGLETIVGARLRDLSIGQIVDASTQLFTRDGDINQEDITNDAVLAWRRCRASASASLTTPASTTSRCRAIPACSAACSPISRARVPAATSV